MNDAMTLDDVRAFMSRLGSFWSQLFDARGQIVSWSRAGCWRRAQLYLDLLEAVRVRVFADIPVFHRELWTPLPFTGKEFHGGLVRYGDGYHYGDPIYYGVPTGDIWEVAVAPEMKGVRFILNNPVSPTAAYSEGVHFSVSNGVISWRVDPFADPRNAGAIVDLPDDRAMTLWGYSADIDKDYIYKHLGSLVQMALPSSELYKAVAVQLARLYAEFPSYSEFVMLVCALAGVPAAQGVETVEVVLESPRKQIITDKRVYDAPGNARVLVKPGDRVIRGDVMTDAVSVVELAYRMPREDELPALSLGVGLLSGEFDNELVFVNRPAPVTEENGMPRVPVVGSPDDVARFWAGADAAGGLPIAPGSYVNPARMLLDCMSGNAMVVKVNTASLVVPQVALATFMRRALSPRIILITHINHEITDDSVKMVEPGEDLEIIAFYGHDDAAAPAVVDVVTPFPAREC
jgi:hypothetical protein